MNFLTNIFKRKCKHDPDMLIKIEEGNMAEPGCEVVRKVKMRICTIQCLKCKQILKLSPLGVVHDPVKNIFMQKEEKEVHAFLTVQEKEQLLKELKK